MRQSMLLDCNWRVLWSRVLGSALFACYILRAERDDDTVKVGRTTRVNERLERSACRTLQTQRAIISLDIDAAVKLKQQPSRGR